MEDGSGFQDKSGSFVFNSLDVLFFHEFLYPFYTIASVLHPQIPVPILKHTKQQ